MAHHNFHRMRGLGDFAQSKVEIVFSEESFLFPVGEEMELVLDVDQECKPDTSHFFEIMGEKLEGISQELPIDGIEIPEREVQKEDVEPQPRASSYSNQIDHSEAIDSAMFNNGAIPYLGIFASPTVTIGKRTVDQLCVFGGIEASR